MKNKIIKDSSITLGYGQLDEDNDLYGDSSGYIVFNKEKRLYKSFGSS